MRMVSSKRFLALFLASVYFSPCVHGFIEGLYCGRENCYDVLGVTRDSSKAEISKAYRKLARKFHPDRYKGPDAETKFQLIATAYETLRDDEQRNDYNYMLDNPEETYQHYYYYYRHRVAPKVDVRLVIAVTISIISVLQYLHGWSRYNDAVNYALNMPKYRNKAMQRAKEEGLLNKQKKRGKRSKEEVKEEEEAILRKVVEESLDIRGGHSKPSVVDVLWLQILLSPFYFVKYLGWLVRWYWKFAVKKEEYGHEEKSYVMRKKMGLSQTQWDAQDAAQIKEYFGLELWIDENFKEWKEEQEEEMRLQLAQNNRYKAYRRFMKKGGAGRITFLDED